MGMGSRQPMRGQNEAFGRNQINPRGMGFMPASQPRMSGGKEVLPLRLMKSLIGLLITLILH